MNNEEFKKELKERYASYYYERARELSETWVDSTHLERSAYAKEQIFKDIF
jgi:hypothetical protein